MDLGRISKGEWISSCSAILLFIFMFFHWFGVKLVNTSNLLFAIQSIEPGKNAWEALDCIPIVLLLATIAPLAVVALQLTNAVPRARVLANALVGLLGFVSVLLILYRIVNPPVFYVETTITSEGTIQFPIFLALLSAAGIGIGGAFSQCEKEMSLLPGLRAGRNQDQTQMTG
jgi:hypothetical protein